MFSAEVIERLKSEFGGPSRATVKVTEFRVNGSGVVVENETGRRDGSATIWLPYPPEGGNLPEIALEYAAEAGRHSGTYPAPGLGKGRPALKLVVHSNEELVDTIAYIKAMKAGEPLPIVKSSPRVVADLHVGDSTTVDTASMPPPVPPKPRREAIPRSVQREVWQRDGGRCVECGTKEKLCFDHIVPFSRGGSNTVRNLQLLCEHCNGSKGNRI